MNFFSISCTSGSENVRPRSRFNDPMVFLKFDVSCVLAGSPMARVFGPKATNDLGSRRERRVYAMGWQDLRCSAIRDFIGDDIDPAVSGDADLQR